MKTTANNVIAVAKKYLGYGVNDLVYREILSVYNMTVQEKEKAQPNEPWSSTFLSVCFVEASSENAYRLIGLPEKNKKQFIAKLKKKRIYFETGSNSLKVGDLVDFKDDNVGIIEAINGRVITIIVGDKDGTIGRIRCLNNDPRLNGFARPKYASEKKAIDEVANEVILGKWGNGSRMVHNITVAGYDYEKVRLRVCELS